MQPTSPTSGTNNGDTPAASSNQGQSGNNSGKQAFAAIMQGLVSQIMQEAKKE